MEKVKVNVGVWIRASRYILVKDTQRYLASLYLYSRET